MKGNVVKWTTTGDIESSKVSNKGESTAEGKSEAYICLLHSRQFSQEKSAVSKVTSQSEIKDAAQSSVSKAIDQSRKDMSRDFSAISRRTAHVRKRCHHTLQRQLEE
ncbi:conserved hypothetical protein [Trichinella spiralis]|uniref:hypothetical protein n=1 Tax=Trichinella spiralis TaxID=6334 RepID=UPI0001EFD8D5|nr:conserved hypothetical protein [Trichinella spiralis]